MRRALSVVLLSLFSMVAYSQQEFPTPSHTTTTAPPNARFEIVQSTLAAKFTFKLDRYSGAVWQMVRDKSGDNLWERMAVNGLPDIPSTAPTYQLFISGLASKFIFLLNTKTGQTWQLQTARDADGNEYSEWNRVP